MDGMECEWNESDRRMIRMNEREMSVHKSPPSIHSPHISLTRTTQRGFHSHPSTTPVISDDHRKRERRVSA